MCENCFQNGIYKFDSSAAFDQFEKLLDEKIKFGVFNISTKRQEKNFYNAIYDCKHCSEKWLLSDPDNGWRGYFLRKDDAIAYENKINREGKIRTRGCLIFIGLSILLLIILFFAF